MQSKPRLARGLSQEKRFFGGGVDRQEQLHQQQQSSYPYQSCWESAMDNSIEPHENDVLMGRGGLNNKHSGNDRLRELARQYGGKYKTLTKKEKSDLSRSLVRRMRELEPPARFLRRVQQSGTWEEVGDDIAREKASQVLRDAVSGFLDNRKTDADATNDGTTTKMAALVPTVSAQTSTDVDELEHTESPPQHASVSRHHHHPPQHYEPAGILSASQPQLQHHHHAASTMLMPSQVPSSSPYSPVPYPPYQHHHQLHQQQQHHLHHSSPPPPYQLHPSSTLPLPPPLPSLETTTTTATPPLERKRRRHYMVDAVLPPPLPVPYASATSVSDGTYSPMIQRYHSENTYLAGGPLLQRQQRRPWRVARQRSANSTDDMGQLLAGELLESDSETEDVPALPRSA